MAKTKFRMGQKVRDKITGFEGIIVTGGPKSGISNMIGELQEEYDKNNIGKLTTIAYLPDKNSDVVKECIDKRYHEYRYTEGTDFSLLEALTFWEDFLSSGSNPEQVKLIGFNGGKISASEYRIALALGAKVGIIQDSGGEADKLIYDPLWKEYQIKISEVNKGDKNLYVLDLKSNDVKEFLQI